MKHWASTRKNTKSNLLTKPYKERLSIRIAFYNGAPEGAPLLLFNSVYRG